MIEPAGQQKPRRLRSLLEIAALAAFVVIVPRLVEAAYGALGYATDGYNRIGATGLIFVAWPCLPPHS